MAKILKVADMRDLEAQVTQGKITYSRMLELIEAKILEQCVLKDDLLAHIETTSDVMKEIAYNEDNELSEKKQAYDRFSALEWLKDWVPHLVNMANAENGHIKSELSEAARKVGQYGNCIAMQTDLNIMDARCSKCGHEWKIELPAIYKETFCPKCGE